MDIDRTTSDIILSMPEQAMTGLSERIPVDQASLCVEGVAELLRESSEQAARYAADPDPSQQILVHGVERKNARLRRIMDDLLRSASMLTNENENL